MLFTSLANPLFFRVLTILPFASSDNRGFAVNVPFSSRSLVSISICAFCNGSSVGSLNNLLKESLATPIEFGRGDSTSALIVVTGKN